MRGWGDAGWLAIGVLSMIAGGAMSGCKPSGGEAPAAAKKKVKIGYLVKQPEESWFQKEWAFADKAGEELGFEVVKIGTTDGEKVLVAIDNLAAQGAQGFVICTPDVKLGPAIVARARQHDLKVVAVDDRFVGADGQPMTDVPYLGCSARKIGEGVGRAIGEELARKSWPPEETGAIAITFDELETARDRVDGAASVLASTGFAKERIFQVPQKSTDVEGGFNAASVVVTKNPNVKHWAVFALNDETVTGAIRALEGRGFKPEDIVGVGINGMAAASTEFKKPEATGFYGSFLLQAKVHGYGAAKMLHKWIVTGEQPPLETRTDATLITRANYREVYKEAGLEDLL